MLEYKGGSISDYLKSLSYTDQQKLLAKLANFITDRRKARIAQVVNNRTLKLAVLLEDLYQPHNISACLRSLDMLGVLQVHIIEKLNSYRENHEVSMGAASWLQVFKHKINHSASYQALFTKLRTAGYKIVTTHLHPPSSDNLKQQIQQINFSSHKIIVCFGTEETGLSSAVSGDYNLSIPSYGFTQSYNVSVAVSLLISKFREVMTASKKSFLKTWSLNEHEKMFLTLHYYISSTKMTVKNLPQLLV